MKKIFDEVVETLRDIIAPLIAVIILALVITSIVFLVSKFILPSE